MMTSSTPKIRKKIRTRKESPAFYSNALLYFADPRFRIIYLIPHPDQDATRGTPFTGATMGLIETAMLLEWAQQQIADIREITSNWSDIAKFRVRGYLTHEILPIENSALEQLSVANFVMDRPFVVVVSWEDNFEFVKDALKNAPNYWLHVSTEKAHGCIAIEDFNSGVLLTYARQRIEELKARKYPDEAFVKICDSLLTGTPPQRRPCKLEWKGHNITRPNENALISFGYNLEDNEEQISPGSEANAHRWIYSAFREVSNRRDSFCGKNNPHIANALCIYLPAILKKIRHRSIPYKANRRGNLHRNQKGNISIPKFEQYIAHL